MEEMAGKEAVQDMEYLLELLHREWGRSGRTKAEVSIGIADREEAEARLAGEIRARQKQLEAAEAGFRECMELSKENFILLRLARKIKKAGIRAGCREHAVSFCVEMDREEYGLFATLFCVREG